MQLDEAPHFVTREPRTEVRGHAEVGNSGGGKHDERELVEETSTAGSLEETA